MNPVNERFYIQQLSRSGKDFFELAKGYNMPFL